MQDEFRTRRSFDIGGGKTGTLYSLPALAGAGFANIGRLPVSIRILLESLLRNCDGLRVGREHVADLAGWQPQAQRTAEIPFLVGRVVLHEVAGIPALGDLAALRSAAARLGQPPAVIEPTVPVTMVIDHTLVIEHHDVPDAIERNMRLEIEHNEERFQFLKWAMQAFRTLRVIPPGNGILHQINLENLARGLLAKDGVYYPDTLVGTDSHTVMVNGIGIVGWGVGGIEATSAMLEQPIYMLTPDVVGVHVSGRAREGVTATDIVLSLTEQLRRAGVVNAFVEFFGEGVSNLSVPDRATMANMAPEYGATIGFFPPDEALCKFFETTGRTEAEVTAFRNYYVAQGMFGIPESGAIDYSRVIEFDLGAVRPCVAGPRRPQDRVDLPRVPAVFRDCLARPVADGGYGKPPAAPAGTGELSHGSVLIAAITSCTNTSNPSVMLAAGLVAKKAAARGLRSKPWVKTTLTPGSRVVTRYLEKAGLIGPLLELGFRVSGYGCATCNGLGGPLDPRWEGQVKERDLIGVSVLSGNRNFEARIHPSLKATFLMSPPLVVAYAITGRIDVDLDNEPLGSDTAGKPVYLRELWPSSGEIAALIATAFRPEDFREVYGASMQNPMWDAIAAPQGEVFAWNAASTYLKEPPFVVDIDGELPGLRDIRGARPLAILGDTITTDHISPVSVILPDSPSGRYLQSLGIGVKDFNTYGARRINHEVMMRGTFANPRLRNLMLPGTEGGVTAHQPTGERLSIYDAAMRYASENVPCVVVAGRDYGMGSARDWAAKGTRLLGVRFVVAQSFERIHRTNLVRLGVVPVQFEDGHSAQSLGLDGSETFDLVGFSPDTRAQQRMTLVIHSPDGHRREIPVRLRLDTPMEIEYARHGGILPYLLRTTLDLN